MILFALLACVGGKPGDSGPSGDWDAFEDAVWTVTGITDQAGGPGIHPWGVVEDCDDRYDAGCTTCFELDYGSGTLTTWVQAQAGGPVEEHAVEVEYTDNGGILGYIVFAATEDTAATHSLDGEESAEWVLNLEDGAYNRRMIDMWSRLTLDDRMWVEQGCPLTLGE